MEQKLFQYDKDCEWAFGLNRMVLHVLGVWPNDYKYHSYLKNLRVPFMLLWILFGFFLPQIYALVKVFPNLTLIIDNVLTISAGFFALIKLFLIWHNRQLFEPLIRWMTADWTNEKTVWERQLMLKQAQRGRLFTISGFALMISNVSSFVLAPFFDIKFRIINNITDLDERRYFPLQTYYPYEFTKSPSFELTYLAQLIALGFAGASFSAADNFFGVLVFHAAGQCEVLSSKLILLFDAASFDHHDLDKITSFKGRIRWMVNKHVYLARFVVLIEKSFNILILAHSLCLSVIICCVGFAGINFLANENSSTSSTQIILLTLFMFNALIHMLVYCAATEILTSNSQEFIQAIYNSNWFLFPAKYSRDVIPMMIRSQYPFGLTVGKFFDLSLSFFAKILKTATGFISMLLAVS